MTELRLDAHFPERPFDARRPATFVYLNLVRRLILESKERAIMPNDGIDFGQAMVASAYATVATLDKRWRRRVEHGILMALIERMSNVQSGGHEWLN
jgi:hypothetical protein